MRRTYQVRRTFSLTEMTEPVSSADYYTWRTFQARVNGRSIQFASKPGLPDWERADRAAQLLAEAIEVGQGERLIDLRCGQGLVATLAALRGASVTAVDDHVVAVEATRRTLVMNGVTAMDDNAPGYDVAALTIPKSREAQRRLMHRAGDVLKPGGRLYLAGANRGGVKSAVEDLAAVFGSAQVIAYGQGCRVARAVRPATFAPDDGDGFAETKVEIRGDCWPIVTGPGVFAQGRLDDGTRCLIEAVEFRAGESLLDLGCGCGIIGLAGARSGNHVTCVDASATAVEATRRTLALAGVEGAHVVWSDCASAVKGRRFDVVATNPPFHQGAGTDRMVAHQFVRDAAEVLRPGGRLVLVANRFLPYRQVMTGLFKAVNVIYEDNRFCVFEAIK